MNRVDVADSHSRLRKSWQRSASRAKRWIAVAGILGFLISLPSTFYGEQLLARWPITSANFIVYQTANAIMAHHPYEEIRKMLTSWVKINPTALGVWIADPGNHIVLSTVENMHDNVIGVAQIDDRMEVGKWFLAHIDSPRYLRANEYHFSYQAVQDINDNIMVRIWAISPQVAYQAWYDLPLLLIYLPNLMMAFWTILFWLSVPIWIYLDVLLIMEEDNRRAWLWSIAGLSLNVIGLVAYLVAERPRLQQGDSLTRSERRWSYAGVDRCSRNK